MIIKFRIFLKRYKNVCKRSIKNKIEKKIRFRISEYVHKFSTVNCVQSVGSNLFFRDSPLYRLRKVSLKEKKYLIIHTSCTN